MKLFLSFDPFFPEVFLVLKSLLGFTFYFTVHYDSFTSWKWAFVVGPKQKKKL